MSRVVSQDIRTQVKAAKEIRESFKDDPAKARKWLIKLGILTKSGKKVALPYR